MLQRGSSIKAATKGKTLASFDYGERRLGVTITFQLSRRSRLKGEFECNLNLFPKKRPTVESLMSKYDMWQFDSLSSPEVRMALAEREDEEILHNYHNVWPGEFEQLEANYAKDKLQLAKCKSKVKRLQDKVSANQPLLGSNEKTDLAAAQEELARLEIEGLKLYGKGRTTTDRLDDFMLKKVFGAEDVDAEYDEEMDEERIPSDRAKKTEMVNEILGVYFEFWERTIGKIDYVAMEDQVATLGAKGAIGMASMTALMLNLANPNDRRGRPGLRHIDPKDKGRVYPFQPFEVEAIIRSGKHTPRWWRGIGPSGHIKIAVEVLPPKHRKALFPSFPEYEDYAEEKRIAKLAKASLKKLNAENGTTASNAAKHPIAIECDKSSEAGAPKNNKKRKREEQLLASPSPAVASKTYEVIDLDDDEEVDGMGFISPLDVKQPAASKSGKRAAKKTAASTSGKKNKKQANDMDVDVIDDNVEGPPKKKKRGSGNRRGGAGGAGYAYFSIGDKEVAEKRIFNKKEAVRRTNLLFEHHQKDFIGAKWMIRYRHKWNDEMRRDVADAKLQMLHCMHELWLKEEEASS